MDHTTRRYNGPPGQEDMPYLLTPGPLTTSRGVKSAMLADWGSRDIEFRRVVSEIRKGLLGLAGIGGEVVELAGGVGIGVGQGVGLHLALVVVVSAGAAVGDVFPLTATNRKGALACKGLSEQIGPDRSGGGAFEGLRDVTDYPNITRVLLERGWNEADLAKLWGGNTLRVMRAT